MKKRLGMAIILAFAAVSTASAEFDDDFTGATLRIDYYHSGTATEERLSLDRARVEGPWPGSRTHLIDTTNLGKYLIEVVTQESECLLYSHGFCSIYGEWETTGEARAGIWRTFPEAVRIPEPRNPFHLRLKKRDDKQRFHEIWSISVDPASRFVDRAPTPKGDVWDVMVNGPPSTKLDLVVLGDGYATAELDKFRGDVKRIVAALLETEPFASRKTDFNVRAINTPAEQSGITQPRAGIFRNTPLRTRCNIFDIQRYALTFDDRAWRDVAAATPYDFVLILLNGPKSGGGGIHNLYAIVAADSPSAGYLAAHEFGHHFAGLGDEYWGNVAYEEYIPPDVEPWEPNVTALRDPATLKWRDLVSPNTPLPTPWDRAAYEELSAQRQRDKRSARGAEGSERKTDHVEESWRARLDRFFAGCEHAGKVGAFEGAMYMAQGLYRPCLDCIMFTTNSTEFCPVCRCAIERCIDSYTR